MAQIFKRSYGSSPRVLSVTGDVPSGMSRDEIYRRDVGSVPRYRRGGSAEDKKALLDALMRLMPTEDLADKLNAIESKYGKLQEESDTRYKNRYGAVPGSPQWYAMTAAQQEQERNIRSLRDVDQRIAKLIKPTQNIPLEAKWAQKRGIAVDEKASGLRGTDLDPALAKEFEELTKERTRLSYRMSGKPMPQEKPTKQSVTKEKAAKEPKPEKRQVGEIEKLFIQNLKKDIQEARKPDADADMAAKGKEAMEKLSEYDSMPDEERGDFIAKMQEDATRTKLSEEEEGEFQDWYAYWADAMELNPDPDDPKHQYDYRAAWMAGVEPDKSGHWPSEFKKAGHPNRFVNGVDTKTGKPDWRQYAAGAQKKTAW